MLVPATLDCSSVAWIWGTCSTRFLEEQHNYLHYAYISCFLIYLGTFYCFAVAAESGVLQDSDTFSIDVSYVPSDLYSNITFDG